MAITGAVTGILREMASGELESSTPFSKEKVSKVRDKANGRVFTIRVGATTYTVYVTAKEDNKDA